MKRVALHLLLWTAYAAVEYFANLPHFDDRSQFLGRTLFFIPVIALPFYLVAYVLVPRLLWRGRKLLFWLACTVVFFVVVIFRLEWEHIYYVLQGEPEVYLPLMKIQKNLVRDYAVIALGVCLKIIRDWDRKDRLTTQLTLEKRDAELQILRAQIHPHFLFNTLNNLYGLALTRSPHTPDSILRLSGLLDVMLYECGGERIAVAKEIELIAHYLELEKLRFGDRLALRFDHEVTAANAAIAPLLLLPFVENAFKHGAAAANDRVFVELDLRATEHGLHFRVENSCAPAIDGVRRRPRDHSGIGLTNVRKRLELLYPGRHDLRTHAAAERYRVDLTLIFTL
jgi:two-component system LytT family sensor kinase